MTAAPTATLEMSPAETLAFWALEYERTQKAYDRTEPGTVARYDAWNIRAQAYNHLLAAEDAAATAEVRARREWDNAQRGAEYYGL